MALSTKIYHKSFRPIKSGFRFVVQVILPFILGMVANMIFAFIFLGAWLNGASWSESIYSILLFALFLLIFPFLYFWLARKYIIIRGLALLYENSQGIVSEIIGKIVNSVVEGKEKLENSPAFVGKTLSGIGDYIKGANTNRTLRTALNFLLQRAPIFASFSKINEEMDLTTDNLPQIKAAVQKDVDDFVKEELIGGSSTWLWLFFLTNIALMYIAWQYFA